MKNIQYFKFSVDKLKMICYNIIVINKNYIKFYSEVLFMKNFNIRDSMQIRMNDIDRCYYCNCYVPEGHQVCLDCWRKYMGDAPYN